MHESCLQPWIDKVVTKKSFDWEKSRSTLHGSTCFFKEPGTALSMLKCVDPFTRPVLFALCLQNYRKVPGVILHDQRYSAHPQEGQVILQEKTEVYVMSV